MARVVQRRGNPPYLLILFVFLFLLAATLAIVFYNSSSDNKRTADDLATQNNMLASAVERNNSDVGARLAKARSGGQSVLGQMSTDLHDCITLLMGSDVSATEAIENAKALKAPTGLVPEVTKLNDALKAAAQRNDELAAQNKQLQGQVQKDQEAMAAAEQTFSENMKKAQDQLTANQNSSASQATDYQGSLDGAKKEWTAKLAEKDSRITLQVQEGQKAKQEIMMLNNKVSLLENQLRQSRPTGPGEKVALIPDGKVIRTAPEENRVYINIGSDQKVHTGMTFGVYDPDRGVDSEGRSKARLVVTNVMSQTAECRITDSRKDQPVIEGDIIANVAYDPTRTYNFVVEGDFDLAGSGKTDPQGLQRIKDMITQYGGKIVDAVTVDTDFVVMGVEPVAPLKPGDTAPATEQQLYRERMKEVEHYRAVKDTAVSLQVPVLNTNRFLALVGYTPQH